MTICNKIQTVGETMETNLNARGVSCTFGTGTGESTVLDMVEMVNDTNFKGSSDVNLKIGANRPYLLENETTDVVVKLENGLCEPLKNKNVTIEQSIFIDNGTTTSHNDHYWTISSYGTITRQTNDTKILNTSGTNSYIGYYVVPMDKTINETNTYSFNAPCIIEFDITDTSNTTVTNCNFQIYSNTTSDYVMEDITTSRIGHWKIIWGETEQKVYVDDTLIGTYNKTLTNARITFRARNNYYLCFKNFIIYKTINGVSDEKGEFALYDVSVTDDTIFTANYETETATCLVEYCTFVDYAVTSNHNDSWDGLTYMNRGTDGTTINNTGSGTLFERIKINNSTAPFSNGDFTVTLKILSVSGSDNRLRVLGATICSGEPYAQADYTLLSTSIGEFKMVYDSTNHTVKVYKDGTLLVTTNRALCGNLNFNFRIPTGGSIKYKDFRVKSL